MGLYDPIYGYSGQPTLQLNPTMPIAPPQPAIQQPPFVKIVTLNGIDAAKSVKLAPGSTLLAADETEAVIWFIKANDVGPNTVSKIPFDPSIFSGGVSAPSVDVTAIEKRLTDIEERMNQYESNASNDYSKSGNSNSSSNSNRR